MTLIRMGSGILLAVIALGLAAQDDPKVKAKDQEDEAKKKISEFNKAKSKSKNDDELGGLIDTLASMQHPKILSELSNLIKAGSDAIKIKVAGHIGKYKGDKMAADYLLMALAQESGKAKKSKQGDDIGHETSVAIINALGEVAFKPSADKLHPFFRHQNIEIAKASIRASGMIRSLSTPDQLIKMMQEMEQAAAQSQAPPGAPPPGALPPGAPQPPPGAPPGVNPQAQLQQEQARRRSFLEAIMHEALKSIIGLGPYKTSSEWAKAWSSERPKLIKKEQEEEKAKNKRD